MRRIAITVNKFPPFLRENPGAVFILLFILSLIAAAAIYPYDRHFAEELGPYAFYFLVVGVVLQVIAIARQRNKDKPQIQ